MGTRLVTDACARDKSRAYEPSAEPPPNAMRRGCSTDF